MGHRHPVPAPKSVPVVMPKLSRHVWMSELIPVIHIRRPVVLCVLSRPFQAILKSAALVIPVLLRRCVPPSRTLPIAGRRGRGTILRMHSRR